MCFGLLQPAACESIYFSAQSLKLSMFSCSVRIARCLACLSVSGSIPACFFRRSESAASLADFNVTGGYGPSPSHVSLPNLEYLNAHDFVLTVRPSLRTDSATCKYKLPPSGYFPGRVVFLTNVADNFSAKGTHLRFYLQSNLGLC